MPSPAATTEGISTEQIRAAFSRNPQAMTMVLARQLNVSEVQVIRALPDGLSQELDASRWEPLIRSFAELGNVHVIVSNAASTLESFGTFGNFSTFAGHFNVQTKSLDMHLRPQQLAAIFAVRKPGHLDGVETLSFQFFTPAGDSAFKVFLTFGGSVPSLERAEHFKRLVEQFRPATPRIETSEAAIPTAAAD